MKKIYATIDAGGVEYSKTEAEWDIDDLIQHLEEVKAEGATHVVGLSGNYRGAQYVRLGFPEVDLDDIDEDDEE